MKLLYEQAVKRIANITDNRLSNDFAVVLSEIRRQLTINFELCETNK